MKPNCYKCIWMVTFRDVSSEHLIRICTCDGIDESDDGSVDLVEVSHFDPSECIAFKATE
jgi:hypothetical protein